MLAELTAVKQCNLAAKSRSIWTRIICVTSFKEPVVIRIGRPNLLTLASENSDKAPSSKTGPLYQWAHFQCLRPAIMMATELHYPGQDK